MAQLKEGRCFNCGSILRLDPQMEKGHCIYCDAVFENKLAFEIEQDPDAYTFENKEMPPYEGPSLDPIPTAPVAVTFSPPPKATAKAPAKATAANLPKYEPKVREIPEVKPDLKVGKIAAACLILVLALFLGVMIPKTKSRDSQRELMVAEFAKSVEAISGSSEKAIVGEDFVISGMTNNQGILIIHTIEGEAQARQYFEAFIRARGADQEGKVSLDLIARDQRYRLEQASRDDKIIVDLGR